MKNQFISIENKLKKSYFIIVLIPLLLFATLSYFISKHIIYDEAGKANLVSIKQVSSKLELVLDDIISVSNIYFFNDHLLEILWSEVPLDRWSYEYKRNIDYVDNIFWENTYAFGWLEYRTFIFGVNGTSYVSNDLIELNDSISYSNMVKYDWFQEAVDKKGRVVWVADIFNDIPSICNKEHYISAVRTLNNINNGESMGLLVMSVNKESMEVFYNNAVENEESIYIVDETNRVISSYPNNVIGEEFSLDHVKNTKKQQSGYYIDKYNGKKNLIVYNTVKKTNWKIYKLIPVNELTKPLYVLGFFIIVSCIILIIVIIYFSYYMAKQFSNPIHKLYKDMKLVGKGNLHIRSQVETNDEIGVLAFQFNRMLGQIKELMDNLIREQKEKRKAEIESLQAQVNPHFLYNTLASIRFMLDTHDKKAVDNVILSLVGLLKSSLTRGNEFITIKEEIENIARYMTIQNVRYGNGLKVIYQIDDNILELYIIKLLLQPIVENAIFHGLQPNGGKGKIIIKGIREEDTIIFSVIDNGKGISEDKLKQISNCGKLKNSFSGIGIKHVEDRIILHFGDKYGIKIDSCKDKETIVKIKIPVIKEIQ